MVAASLRTVLLTWIVFAGHALAAAIVGPFSGITVFGDSLSDTGNVYRETDGRRMGLFTLTARPDQPFYTQRRFTCGSDNTGLNTDPVKSQRTSFDGVWHEHLAKRLGLDPATPSLAGGENYAYGGAETGNGTGNFGITTHLRQQVSQFIGNRQQIPSDRLYLVWAGGNDLVNAAQASNATPQTIDAAKTTAISNLKAAITSLYNKGARKFLWPNLPPLEKTPEIAKLNVADQPGPQARFHAVKKATGDFKADQAAAVTALQQNLPEIQIALLDVFTQFNDLVSNPRNYNLENVDAPFVTTSLSGISVTGSQNRLSVGKNPDTWIFWDSLHPTSYIHSLIGRSAEARVPEPSLLAPLLWMLACVARVGFPGHPRRRGGTGGRRPRKSPRG
ncbi:MAG: SGNH/GDSL hydrolase family protein [Phycisphaerae bacterium]|nr:SGNH/GDSL hydrolase family protein [Phycisphaerae bacterium]